MEGTMNTKTGQKMATRSQPCSTPHTDQMVLRPPPRPPPPPPPAPPALTHPRPRSGILTSCFASYSVTATAGHSTAVSSSRSRVLLERQWLPCDDAGQLRQHLPHVYRPAAKADTGAVRAPDRPREAVLHGVHLLRRRVAAVGRSEPHGTQPHVRPAYLMTLCIFCIFILSRKLGFMPA